MKQIISEKGLPETTILINNVDLNVRKSSGSIADKQRSIRLNRLFKFKNMEWIDSDVLSANTIKTKKNEFTKKNILEKARVKIY